MTLDQWIKKGGCMLSNYTEAYCCYVKKIAPEVLRGMDLRDIFAIPGAGNVARREIHEFARENNLLTLVPVPNQDPQFRRPL